jgi:hypothetical protein
MEGSVPMLGQALVLVQEPVLVLEPALVLVMEPMLVLELGHEALMMLRQVVNPEVSLVLVLVVGQDPDALPFQP